MRPTLLGSLLDAARHNVFHNGPDVAIFESGTVYRAASGDLPADEHHALAALMTGALAPVGCHVSAWSTAWLLPVAVVTRRLRSSRCPANTTLPRTRSSPTTSRKAISTVNSARREAAVDLRHGAHPLRRVRRPMNSG